MHTWVEEAVHTRAVMPTRVLPNVEAAERMSPIPYQLLSTNWARKPLPASALNRSALKWRLVQCAQTCRQGVLT